MNAQKLTEELMRNFYQETDEYLLLLMSSGVPSSNIIMTPPRFNVDNNIAKIECYIGFK